MNRSSQTNGTKLDTLYNVYDVRLFDPPNLDYGRMKNPFNYFSMDLFGVCSPLVRIMFPTIENVHWKLLQNTHLNNFTYMKFSSLSN